MDETALTKKKHPLRKIWDIFVTILGVGAFLLIFAFFQVYQDMKPKEKEMKPSVQIETLQKKVDSLYQSKERKESDIFKLYSEIRKSEDVILKEAKANDEKALLKGEITSLKQDVLMLEQNIAFPTEPKVNKKPKK